METGRCGQPAADGHPEVGLLTATAAVVTIGEAGAFKSGREFAAYVGLMPRQAGTGGRVKMLGLRPSGRPHPTQRL